MHAFDSRPHARFRLAEKEVHGVNAMRSDVIKRAAAGKRGIGEPFAAGNLKPAMAVGLGEERAADGAFRDELLGPEELGIESAVIRNAEEATW